MQIKMSSFHFVEVAMRAPSPGVQHEINLIMPRRARENEFANE